VSVASASAARLGRISAALGSGQLFLRRLRLDPVPPLTMLALLALTCFLFASLPRLFNDVADDGLRYMVGEATVDNRNVRMLETGRIPAGPASASLEPVAERAARSREELPAALRDGVAESTFVVQTPRYILQADAEASAPRPGATTPGAAPGLIRYLTLRAQAGAGPQVRVVAGRLPRPSGEHARPEVRQPVFSSSSVFQLRRVEFISWASRVPVLEIALSELTARELRLSVGDRAVYLPDRTQFAFSGVALRDATPLVVEVVGLIAVKDLAAPYWFGEDAVQVPNIQRSQDVTTTRVYAHALTAPDAYSDLLAASRSVPLTYEFRHLLDVARLDAGRLGQLNAAVAELETRYAAAGPLDRKVETGLGEIFARYATARSQSETLLAVAAIGLFACALANVGLLAALWYSRRREETGVSRARGASGFQVLAAQAAEGLLVAAPAALLGWTAAVLVIEARGSSLSAWLAVGLVIATIVLLLTTIAGVARRPLGPLGRDDVVVPRLSPRRLVLEGAVAVAAAGGVYLLRRRGLESGGADGVDPYLAAVPVLLGLACGIVALRLYPFPIRGLAWLVRRSRGLALHLGLNRAARQSGMGAAPLLVLVLALGIACFSAAMLATLDTGQNRAAWRVVGADARIDAPLDGTLPDGLVARLDEQGDVARAFVQDPEAGAPGQETIMIAVELDPYERIVRDTPAALRFPAELRNAPIPGLIPAVVSTNWPATGTFQITLPRVTVSTLTVGNRDSFPGVPAEMPFAIVPWSELKKTEAEGEIVRPNRLYVGGVGAATVREAVEDMAPRADVETRADIVSRQRESPLVENVFRGFRAAILLAALYAAVAVGLMALIAARSRSRDLALVRTMGASARDAVVLAAVELTPLVVSALALGIGLGIVIPHLIAPGLDLTFFTGTGSTSVVIPWLPPAAFAAGLLGLVAATVIVVGARARRAGLDRALRIGER
jgi:putative ABC transport system permease protein